MKHDSLCSFLIFLLICACKAALSEAASADRCPTQKTRIGVSSTGKANYVTFLSVKVGDVSHSMESCSQNGIPVASAPCIKLGQRAVYNTFEIKLNDCKQIKTTPTFSTQFFETTNHERLGMDEIPKDNNNLFEEIEYILNASTIPSSDFARFADVIERLISLLEDEDKKNYSAIPLKVWKTKVIKALDKLAMKVILSGELSKADRHHFILEAKDISMKRSTKRVFFESNDEEVAFNIPLVSLQRFAKKKNISKTRIGFVFFKDNVLFPSTSFQSYQVISASVGTFSMKNIINPISFRMKAVDSKFSNLPSSAFTCGYWDFDLNDWSESGCFLSIDLNGRVCKCNHLTNFAILVDVHRQAFEADTFHSVPNISTSTYFRSHSHVIDFVSDVGCILSVIGLVFTIVVYISFMNLRQRRPNKVLINLSVALFCAYLVFIFSFKALDHFVFCALVASLQHYFWLCAWCWMAVEAYTMYSLLVKVIIPRPGDKFMRKASLFAYGFPALLAATSALVCLMIFDAKSNYYVSRISHGDFMFNNRTESGKRFSVLSDYAFVNDTFDANNSSENWRSSYLNSNACWLKGKLLYFTFLLPVGAAFVFNLICFVFVFHGINNRQKRISSTAKRRNAQQQLSNVITITVLLGIPWTVGFLGMLDISDTYLVVTQWIYTVFNSTQGFSIFVLFCIRHRSVRTMWINKLRRCFFMKESARETSFVPATPCGIHQQQEMTAKRFANRSNLNHFPTQITSTTSYSFIQKCFPEFLRKRNSEHFLSIQNPSMRWSAPAPMERSLAGKLLNDENYKKRFSFPS